MSAEIHFPSNPGVERAVLGAILVDGSAFYRVADRISSGSFYELKNAAIW